MRFSKLKIGRLVSGGLITNYFHEGLVQRFAEP